MVRKPSVGPPPVSKGVLDKSCGKLVHTNDFTVAWILIAVVCMSEYSSDADLKTKATYVPHWKQMIGNGRPVDFQWRDTTVVF